MLSKYDSTDEKCLMQLASRSTEEGGKGSIIVIRMRYRFEIQLFFNLAKLFGTEIVKFSKFC